MERLPISAPLARFLNYPRVGTLTEGEQEGLRRFWLEGLFSAIGLALSESFYTLYALSLGVTAGQIGLVSTLSQIAGASLSIPGAALADHTGRYKLVAQGGQFLKQAMWLVMAVAPWVLPTGPALLVMLAAWVSVSVFGTLMNSAWTALFGEIVPDRIRGQYFASRSIIMHLCKVFIVPVAGLFVNMVGEPEGYQLIMSLAFVVGLGAIFHFSRLPEHLTTTVDREPFGVRAILDGLRRHTNYRHYVISHAALNLGVMIGSPFMQVYMVQAARFNVAEVSLVNTVGVVAAMLSMYLFGRLQDRKGITWIMRFAVGMPIIPVLWLWVQEPWQAGIVQFYASLAWTGYTVGSFNLVLAVTPAEHRPHYIALHATLAALVGALGPLIGGWLLDATGFMPVFALSTIGRSLGMILFLALVREPAAPGRD